MMPAIPRDPLADLPMQTRCARCGAPYGGHMGLDCPDDGVSGAMPDGFKVSVFDDTEGPTGSRATRDRREYRRLQGLVDAFRADREPRVSIVDVEQARLDEAEAQADRLVLSSFGEQVEAELHCTWCGSRSHDYADCPVADDDAGDEDSGDLEPEPPFGSECTCVDCIAASEYVGPVA